LAQLEKALTATQWAGRKAALLDELNTTGFWERSDRFEVLAAIEAMDRMDAALRSARSLEQRLTTQSFRATLPTTPISNLAQQIYLLSAAVADWEKKLGTEVFLLLEAVGADGASRTVATSWVQRLGEMYLAWAQKRHMRWQRLSAPKATPVVLAISGFGVHGILSRDIGMHLLETEDSDGEPLRAIARLRVLPQPTAPNPRNSLQVALDCFAREPEPTMQIVRRYRDKPSPLVRDALAGWRTGRLDRVLAGDFDLQGRLPT
jgi:ATP-dependent Clp protease ATP-binding subunit ClpC